MCHGQNSTETLGSFGDYMCDSPQKLVNYALTEAKRIAGNPDLIIWTGDNVPHVEDYTLKDVSDTINQTTQMIYSVFEGKNTTNPLILPTFGNHDYSPSGGFIDNSQLYNWTWSIWKDKIGEDNKGTFLKGGYYKHNWNNSTILCLNTNIYYVFDGAYDNFTDKNDPMGQFAFMEKELIAAQSCKSTNCTKTVNILAHIAPGAYERSQNFTWFRDQYNAKFIDLIRNYSSQIGWMIFGHHHTDTFHLVKDVNNTTPLGVFWMTPAVTPMFSNLPGSTAQNPSFRIWDIDEKSQINDFTTYYLNLTSQNANLSTPFIKEYSFKDAYGIKDQVITSQEVSKLVDNMKNDSTGLFAKYIKFNSVMLNGDLLPIGLYRGLQLCSLEFSDYPSYSECLKPYLENTTMMTSTELMTTTSKTSSKTDQFLIIGHFMSTSTRLPSAFALYPLTSPHSNALHPLYANPSRRSLCEQFDLLLSDDLFAYSTSYSSAPVSSGDTIYSYGYNSPAPISANNLPHQIIDVSSVTLSPSLVSDGYAPAIVSDVSVAKRMVLKATELAFEGTKFDVFCATGEFSYSIHSRTYCEVTREDVTCFAFR
ncbi:hypothetical protein WR25_24430 isoform A [Diploscapter pachys]|uniref:Ground-like domain-containing protein n=1 Tax=Diploscapter pachys TaxID=2018661 RepID=A0A2A2LIP0_9BILA|nr:hypothetical protein WR25_24430 isoform A [Diploscapter pachys]